MLTPDTGTGVVHSLPSGKGAWRVRGTDGKPLMAARAAVLPMHGRLSVPDVHREEGVAVPLVVASGPTITLVNTPLASSKRTF